MCGVGTWHFLLPHSYVPGLSVFTVSLAMVYCFHNPLLGHNSPRKKAGLQRVITAACRDVLNQLIRYGTIAATPGCYGLCLELTYYS